MRTLKDAGPWIAFLLLVPMILYILLGGVGYSMDQMDQKKAACAQAGGIMTRDYQCVKAVKIP